MKRLLLLSLVLLLFGCGKSYYLAEDLNCKSLPHEEKITLIKTCMTEFKELYSEDLFAKCEQLVKESKCEKQFSYYTVSMGLRSDEKSPHIPCTLTTDPKAQEVCPKTTFKEKK